MKALALSMFAAIGLAVLYIVFPALFSILVWFVISVIIAVGISLIAGQ